jgi:hypothetical protein
LGKVSAVLVYHAIIPFRCLVEAPIIGSLPTEAPPWGPLAR